MSIDDGISLSLPFIASGVLQFLQPAARKYAVRCVGLVLSDESTDTDPTDLVKSNPEMSDATRSELPVVIAGEPQISDEVKRFGIDLAVHVFGQVNFLTSIILATVSFIGLTVDAGSRWRGLSALLAVFCIVLLAWWAFQWQDLKPSELQGVGGRWMRIWGYGLIIILWGCTLFAQVSKTPSSSVPHNGAPGVKSGVK